MKNRHWLGGSVGWSVSLYIKNVAGSIPSQGTNLGRKFYPELEETDQWCVLSLSLSLSLSPVNISLGEDKKKNEEEGSELV